MSEMEYKELMSLKNQLQMAEDTDEKDREVESLKTMLFTKLAGIESRIGDLEDLREVYQEVLEDL